MIIIITIIIAIIIIVIIIVIIIIIIIIIHETVSKSEVARSERRLLMAINTFTVGNL